MFDAVDDHRRDIAARGPGLRSRFAMAASPEGVVRFGGRRGASQYEFQNGAWCFDRVVGQLVSALIQAGGPPSAPETGQPSGAV